MYTITLESALAILAKRDLHFRRAGARWLGPCHLGNHCNPKDKLAVHLVGGRVRVGCWACGFDESLLAFLCLLDGHRPEGKHWRDARIECGQPVHDGPPTPPKPIPRWCHERAILPIAMARNAEELRVFTECEVSRGASPKGHYVGSLVRAIHLIERRDAE